MTAPNVEGANLGQVLSAGSAVGGKNMRLREMMAGLNFNCAVPYGATLSDKTLTTSSFRKIEDNHQRQRRTRRWCPAIELSRGHKLGQRTDAAADVLVGL